MEDRRNVDRNNQKERLNTSGGVNQHIKKLNRELKFINSIIDLVNKQSANLKRLNELANQLSKHDITISVAEQVNLFKYLPQIIYASDAEKAQTLEKLIALQTDKEIAFNREKLAHSAQVSGRLSNFGPQTTHAKLVNKHASKMLYEIKHDEVEARNRKIESEENSLSTSSTSDNDNVISAVYQALQIDNLLNTEPTRFEDQHVKKHEQFLITLNDAKNNFLGLFSGGKEKKKEKEYKLFHEENVNQEENQTSEEQQSLKSSLSSH